jgi:hypothetical protein
MSNTCYASILILFGSSDALQGFNRPDFLHQKFFIHCTIRDDCTKKINQHGNTAREMDIFLPDTAVDLIYSFNNLPCPRKQYHLYCETDDLVNRYRILVQSNICEQVFNANQIEKKLYVTAHRHLLHCINNLEKLAEEGDVDAHDLLLPIGELFEQSAAKINDDIRQKADLPRQAAEYEED